MTPQEQAQANQHKEYSAQDIEYILGKLLVGQRLFVMNQMHRIDSVSVDNLHPDLGLLVVTCMSGKTPLLLYFPLEREE